MPAFPIFKLVSMVLILIGVSLPVTLAEPIQAVIGIITDENKVPLEGVKIQICGLEKLHGNNWVREHRLGIMPAYYSDSQGRFLIPYSESDLRYDIYFDKIGYAPTFLYALSPDSTNLNVVMKKGVALTGTVMRLVNGKPVPVAGAMVELQLPSEDLWYQEKAITDNQGKYTFQVTPPPKPKKWQVSFLGETVQVEVKGNEPVKGPEFMVTVQSKKNQPMNSPVNPLSISYPNN
ncbi:MAG: carboxypeptidase-like regulatory domain-containing protein [bacterium]